MVHLTAVTARLGINGGLGMTDASAAHSSASRDLLPFLFFTIAFLITFVSKAILLMVDT